MNNSNLFNSILSFDNAYSILNNLLMEEISSNSNKIESNNIYTDHIANLKSISNFSKIKYLEHNKQKNKVKGLDPINEKISHQRKHLEVIKKIPHSLINDLEKTRISLFLAWNKGIDKKNFCYAELDNYMIHYKNYCEILKSIFGKNDNYDALLSSIHPRFSCESIEKIFKEISPKLKNYSKIIKEFSKNIKVVKLDNFLIKNDQYKEIIKQTKNDFNLSENSLNANEIKIHGILSNHPLKEKFQYDFQDRITVDLSVEIENYFYNKFLDKNDFFENCNLRFLSKTIGYFFSFYLLKSQQYIDTLSDNLKRTLKCKSKISDNQNLYWLFNKYPDESHPNNCNEVHQIFYYMLSYVIEKDLINGNIKANDLPDIWKNGMKHYFDIDVNATHIMHNMNIGNSKFGACVLDTYSIINSAMIFSQYEEKNIGKDFDPSVIKKFFQNFSSENIDYQSYAIFDKSFENIDLLMKTLNSRLL